VGWAYPRRTIVAVARRAVCPFFIDSQQRVSEVVERDFGGSIRRGKGPLRL
jgi:hypothetical protein